MTGNLQEEILRVCGNISRITENTLCVSVGFQTNTSWIPGQLYSLLLQPVPYHKGTVFKPVVWLAAVFRQGSTDQ